MNAIARNYLAACLAELDALKPGNVHRHAGGHGMTVVDFEISAKVSAPGVAAPGSRVGARVLSAVQATRAAVGQNTNLGIVLLCAPLAAAAERGAADLAVAVAAMLDDLDAADARDVFAAIALANPGGLGSDEEHDVRAAPTVALREAMAAAAGRDLVARQYSNNFAEVFGLGAQAYARALALDGDPAYAAEATYLAFLCAFPDSHIARKFGIETAEAVRQDAAARSAMLSPGRSEGRTRALAAWDAGLKTRGVNPGASADLTVATLFAAYLASMRDEELAAPAQQ